MNSELCHIGIDTSNYTTSIAAVDELGQVIFDRRTPLAVQTGDRGLRQSDALFQHLQNMPALAAELFDSIDRSSIRSVSYSDTPRPVSGSYMPVFNAGVDFGKVIASALGVPSYGFSHQEGHLEAARRFSPLTDCDKFIALHLSGGTCEILLAELHKHHYMLNIIGGTKDLSFGQLIDRIGVAMGIDFPAGPSLDVLAMEFDKPSVVSRKFKKVKVENSYFNISGLENQCLKMIQDRLANQLIAFDLFDSISQVLCGAIDQACEKTGVTSVLLVGGVASSSFLRNRISGYFNNSPITAAFGPSSLSSDNAVGTALLGKDEWQGME